MTEAEMFYHEAVKNGQKAPFQEIWNSFTAKIQNGSIKNTLGEWRRYVLKYANH